MFMKISTIDTSRRFKSGVRAMVHFVYQLKKCSFNQILASSYEKLELRILLSNFQWKFENTYDDDNSLSSVIYIANSISRNVEFEGT